MLLIPYNKLIYNPNTPSTLNPPPPLYRPLRSVAILALRETPIPTSIRSCLAQALPTACRSLGLPARPLMVVVPGLPAMRRRWGLRVERRYNSSNYTKVPMGG